MRRVLLVQPSLQPPGGGNGVAAWMLQALAREHRVTVLSWRPIDLDAINRFYGTSLHADEFARLVVPRTWTVVPDHLPVPAALVRSGLLMRYARRVIDAFDVIIGVHNEADYGRRGIQYVHYPTYFRPRPEVDFRWYHRSPAVLQAYYAIADRLGNFSMDRMKANLTLTNSDWTAARVRDFLGIEARTLYPPIVDPGPPIPWEQRHAGFIALGRISPEKEYERVIRILARVQSRLPETTLTIVGTWDRHVRSYYKHLRTLAASTGTRVEFRHNLSRDEVRALLASHRYGIHGMREEHFGMAPAEMMTAGMIVWVPNGGGQVEIVDGHPSLIYGSEEAAAEQIIHVLTSPAEQQRLREFLADRAHLFTTARFTREVQEIVRTFAE